MEIGESERIDDCFFLLELPVSRAHYFAALFAHWLILSALIHIATCRDLKCYSKLIFDISYIGVIYACVHLGFNYTFANGIPVISDNIITSLKLIPVNYITSK